MRKLAVSVTGGVRGMIVPYAESDIHGWVVPRFKIVSFNIVWPRNGIKKNKIVLPTFLISIWHPQKITVT